VNSKQQDQGPSMVENGEQLSATSLNESEVSAAVERFYSACRLAKIPEEKVASLFSVVFHHDWLGNHNQNPSELENDDDVARLIVSIFLQATVEFDLVLVGLDEVSLMDSLSWKVIQLWFEHACNLVVIGTSNPVAGKDINISSRFWDHLFSEAVLLDRFIHIQLQHLTEGDVERLVARQSNQGDEGLAEFSHEVSDFICY